MVLSYLNYGILAWGHACNRIMKLQKKAVRIVQLSSFNAHTEPIFKTLELLKVEDILRLQLLKFYYKYRHETLPYYLQRLPFNQITNIHDYPTRSCDDLRHSKIHHTYMKYFIRYTLPKVVNETPPCILDKINTHSIQGYSKYIKMYIIKSYKKECTDRPCYVCGRR